MTRRMKPFSTRPAMQKLVVMTKDRDFVQLLTRAGPPPQIIWITCGNTSNARMREILTQTFANALALLREGEPFVEIADAA